MDGCDRETFDLELIQKDRVANTLFLIGVVIAYFALDHFEQAIVSNRPAQASDIAASTSTENPNVEFAATNWIYLAAGILFLSTSKARLKEDIDTLSAEPTSSNKERVLGREMVVIGNSFKVIGYLLSAIGNEIIAGSG